MELDLNRDGELPELVFQHTNIQQVHDLLFKYLKVAHLINVPILTYITNLSLDTCIVLNDWKKAEITPLVKEGERTSASNY